MKKKDREFVLSKTGGLCFYCGEELSQRWHADHFYPIRRNPDGSMLHPERDVIENLIPSCPSCNMLKSSLEVEYLRKHIEGFVSSLNKYTTQYKFAKRYGQVVENIHPVRFWFEKAGYDMSEINGVANDGDDNS